MDLRARFFLATAVVCAVLIPLTDAEFRWVPVSLTIVYAVLSLASWADSRTRADS